MIHCDSMITINNRKTTDSLTLIDLQGSLDLQGYSQLLSIDGSVQLDGLHIGELVITEDVRLLLEI